MKYIDENITIIPEGAVDLSKGYLVDTTIIKADALPIDDITKFAWDDSDYEEAKMYVLRKDEVNKPTQVDMLEAQVTYTAMMTNTLLEGNA